jgi:hypothetical protein
MRRRPAIKLGGQRRFRGAEERLLWRARRLGILVAGTDHDEAIEQQITDVVAARDFPMGSDDNRWSIHRAYQQFPAAVGAGLMRRLADGLEMPFGTEEMLAGVAPIDAGPIAAQALDLNANKRTGEVAATVIGPAMGGRMCRVFVANFAPAERKPGAQARGHARVGEQN